jgi:hypothetical protein
MPAHVLVGTVTPLGSTGPVQALPWHLRGPLGVLALTAPVLLTAARRDGCPPLPLPWQLPLAAAALLWARRTARRLSAG